MKKTTTLVLVLCSAFLFSACGPSKNIANTASVTPTTGDQKSTFSLKELIAKNIAQKCTWETSEDGNNIKGEILISGKKFKQTMVMKNSAGETKFNTLSDGEWYYTWSNDSTTGNMAIKMKIDQTEASKDIPASQNTKSGNTGSVDLNKEMNYNCQTAVVNDSNLSLPVGINFTDLSEMTKQFQQ